MPPAGEVGNYINTAGGSIFIQQVFGGPPMPGAVLEGGDITVVNTASLLMELAM